MAWGAVSKDSYDPMIQTSSSNRKAKDGARWYYSAYHMIGRCDFMSWDAMT